MEGRHKNTRGTAKMRRAIRHLPRLLVGGLSLWLLASLWCFPAAAVELLMKDGRNLHGRLGEVGGLADLPMGVDADSHIKQIVFLDNDLCRIFVPRARWRRSVPIRPARCRSVSICGSGCCVRGPRCGRSARPSHPGLRRLRPPHLHHEFQPRTDGHHPAITEITPEWTKVEGVTYMWDMRIDTHTIPQEQLHKILWKLIDPKQIEDRKKIARFDLQSERYKDARAELEGILKDFPERTDVRQQLDPFRRPPPPGGRGADFPVEDPAEGRPARVRAKCVEGLSRRWRARRDSAGCAVDDAGVPGPGGPPGQGGPAVFRPHGEGQGCDGTRVAGNVGQGDRRGAESGHAVADGRFPAKRRR